MNPEMKNYSMKNHSMRNDPAPKMAQGAPVQFSLGAPTAHEVYVAGTFNDWNPKATPMLQDGEGPWVAKVNLLPGEYEYKFVVDGEWICDPGCEAGTANCIPNSFGTRNSIVAVNKPGGPPASKFLSA